MNSKKPLIDVQKLSLKKGARLALEDITFQIHKGEYVGIVGPNGAGKTTLLRVLLNLEEVYIGEVKVHGKLAYVPQLIPGQDFPLPMTVEELLRTGSKEARGREALSEGLSLVGLGGFEHRVVQSLSGGERQKAFLARALQGNPDVLLLDEAMSAVDQGSQGEFYELLQKLNHEGLTIVMVSHDIEMVSKEASKVLCINRKLSEDCHPAHLNREGWSRLFGEHVQPVHHHDHV